MGSLVEYDDQKIDQLLTKEVTMKNKTLLIFTSFFAIVSTQNIQAFGWSNILTGPDITGLKPKKSKKPGIFERTFPLTILSGKISEGSSGDHKESLLVGLYGIFGKQQIRFYSKRLGCWVTR